MGERLLLQGGRVFDAVGPDPAPAEADVVIEGDRIVEIGRGLDGDVAVDCSGATLLPGLFDCHTHVTVDGYDLWRMAQTPFSLQFFEAARNLQATLAIGITSVRDAGGADLGVKTAVERGLVDGPRVQISVTMLSQTGGHADKWMVCGGQFPTPFGMTHPGKPGAIVDGPWEMRKKVRELVRAGADVIKLAASGGVLSPRDDPRHGHFRDEELAAAVDEAAAAGRWVMAHAQATDGIKASIRAGIRSIEHGIYLDDEAIGMMLENGTWLVPTLMAPRGVIEAAEAGAQVTDESLAKAVMVIEAHNDSISRAIAAGVKVAMGTDSGVTPHGQNLKELPLMVERGMTPAQSLVATTRSAAELLGVADELGTLEPGKRADVVVVDGDALDVEDLGTRVRAVWKDGTQVVGA
ncbi:MAG TPA: amidohydrolase family protein [Acidimicrobiales bacterium]